MNLSKEQREIVDNLLESCDNRLNAMRQEVDADTGQMDVVTFSDLESRQAELQDFRDHIVDQYGEE